MTTLLTFMGTAQRIDSPHGKSCYKQTCYSLPDNTHSQPVSLVASALLSIHPEVDHLVIVGTLQSHWDELTTLCHDEEQQYPLLEQWDSLENTDKSAHCIQDFANQIGKTCQLKLTICLVPAPTTDTHQVAFFQHIDQTIAKNDNLIVDITHGFRSMPLLTYVALQYLKYTKQITIHGLYYGEFIGKPQSNTINQGAIRNLHAVLDFSRWVTALGQFKHSGNIAVFVPLLQQENWSQENLAELQTAAFYQQINNVSQAGYAARNVINAANQSVMSTLIKPQLDKALHWCNQHERGKKECALAKQYLAQKDYLRAVIYAFEGLISQYLYQQKLDENDYANRDLAKKSLLEQHPNAFRRLNELRNALAHGIRPNKRSKIKASLKNECNLITLINTVFKQLNI